MKSYNLQKLFITLCVFSALTLVAFHYYTATISRVVYTRTSPIVAIDKREKNVGHIWPPRNGVETGDRMLNQINFIDAFWPKHKTGDTSKPLPLRPSQTKVILRLGRLSYDPFMAGQSYFVDEDCPVNSCTITGNMSMQLTADALFLHDLNPVDLLPKPPHQIWITRHSESPHSTHIRPNELKDLVNWTSTYRRDSTVPFGYGSFEPIVNATPIADVNYARGKTERVAWLVSNCRPKHRESYMRELARYIDVDVYGECGTMECPKNDLCQETIFRRYKFYLAFENSHCKDYITEKFFDNSLGHDILPVVMGAPREDYLVVAPPKSYIHVDDFRNPRELAAYLHYLDTNDTAYNEYFAWKGTMVPRNQRVWCRICTLLHLQQADGYVHWYEDYASWWNGVCTAGSNRLHSHTNFKFSTYLSAFIVLLMVSFC